MSFDVFFAVSPVTLIDSLADSPVLEKNDKNAEKLLSGHFHTSQSFHKFEKSNINLYAKIENW